MSTTGKGWQKEKSQFERNLQLTERVKELEGKLERRDQALRQWQESAMKHYPLNWEMDPGNPGMMIDNIVRGARLKPVDMILFCPNCGAQHIDEPNPEKEWTNPPHRSHQCQMCDWVWRPADVPTNGVLSIETKGQQDTEGEPARVYLYEA